MKVVCLVYIYIMLVIMIHGYIVAEMLENAFPPFPLHLLPNLPDVAAIRLR